MNVIIIRRDATCVSFTAENYKDACAKVDRYYRDPMYRMTHCDSVFISSTVPGKAAPSQYSVEELVLDAGKYI